MPNIYAINLKGEVIRADFAINGETYICAFCKKPVHLTHSKKGLCFYAVNPGFEHSNPVCKTMASSKKIASIEMTDFSSFFARWTRKTKATGATGGTGGGTNGGGTDEAEDPDDYVLQPFNSLKDFAKQNVPALGRNYIINDKTRLSDILTTFVWTDWQAPRNSILNHIVEAKLVGKDDSTRTLFFKIFKNNGNVKKKIMLETIVDKREDYAFYATNYFEPKMKGGKTVMSAVPNSIFLIIAAWIEEEKPNCRGTCPFKDWDEFCHDCVSSFYASIYRKGQIVAYKYEKNNDELFSF